LVILGGKDKCLGRILAQIAAYFAQFGSAIWRRPRWMDRICNPSFPRPNPNEIAILP
jgi:hypothetical protein